MTLLFLATDSGDDRYQKRIAKNYAFLRNMSIQEKRCLSGYILISSPNKLSSYVQAQTQDSKDDKNLIPATGFDTSTFQYLLEIFEPIFKSHTPHKKDGKLQKLNNHGRGRRRLIDAATCLWLYLTWKITTSRLWFFQFMFNMTHPSIILYLMFARMVLLDFLQKGECAKIRRTFNEEISEFQRVIGNNYPFIGGAYSVMDVPNITIEKAGEIIEQNKLYNRVTSGHYVTNVFVFCPMEQLYFLESAVLLTCMIVWWLMTLAFTKLYRIFMIALVGNVFLIALSILLVRVYHRCINLPQLQSQK